MDRRAGTSRRLLSFRALLSIYTVIWLCFVLFLKFFVCGEIAHSYLVRVEQLGGTLPALTVEFALAVIGNDPYVLDGPAHSLLHYAIWAALLVSGALPLILVWWPRDESRARWWWLWASIGHALLIVVAVALTTWVLYLPFCPL
jgi:hypothetical protein